jgi:hypothetical protein
VDVGTAEPDQLVQNWKTHLIGHQFGLEWQSQWQELKQHLSEPQLAIIV